MSPGGWVARWSGDGDAGSPGAADPMTMNKQSEKESTSIYIYIDIWISIYE